MDIRELLNPGWVSSAIGLLSLIAALIIYRASQIGPRPAFQRRALRLIGRDDNALPNEVEIRFAGRTVERLTKTQIIFWNSGRALLRGSDIVEGDPLRLDFSAESQVLAATILKATRRTNRFVATVDSTESRRIVLSFDYLDPGDGAVVEILHTDVKRYPEVNGTFRGVPRGVVDYGRVTPVRGSNLPFPFKRRRTFLAVTILLGFAISAAGLLLPAGSLERLFRAPRADAPTRLRGIVVAVGLLYASLPLLLMWLTRRRFPKALACEELDQ